MYVEIDKKVFWVDPTNFVSDAKSINFDIEGTQSLVLKPKMHNLIETESAGAGVNKIYLKKFVKLSDQGKVEVKGELKLLGKAAFNMTGLERKVPKDKINYYLVNSIASDEEPISWNLKPYNLKSNITTDIAFEFDYKGILDHTTTTAGSAVSAPSYDIAKVFNTDISKRVGSLYLGKQNQYTSEYTLSDINIIGDPDNLGCFVKSKWLDISREIEYEKKNLVIKDNLSFHSQIITNEELKSSEFSKIQKAVMKCLGNVSIVYSTEKNNRSLSGK